jgi:transcriptional regulator GlxA family with amidase domain
MFESSAKSLKISVLLLDGFSVLALGSILEPFGLLASECPEVAPRVSLYSITGNVATSATGMPVPCEFGLRDLAESVDGPKMPAHLILCGATTGCIEPGTSVTALLRRAHKAGVSIHAIGNTVWYLAEASQLRGGKATTHWHSLNALDESYFDIEVENTLFTKWGGVTTCAGELAVLDMIMDLIAGISADAAGVVARHLNMQSPRDGKVPQVCQRADQLLSVPQKLRKATDAMAQNLEEPLRIPEIAQYCDISERQLERLFLRHLRTSPMRYYAELRLDRAHQLVSHTNLDLNEVATATGFSTVRTLSKQFRAHYSLTPSQHRAKLDERVASSAG